MARKICMILILMLAAAPAAAQHGASEAELDPSQVPLYDDLGTHTHPITTKSPEAQKYFDQGLTLVYGFNHAEAILAFRKAAELDPDCAMAYWGVALAKGPNYNAEMDAEAAKASYEALGKAAALKEKGSDAERQLIDALSVRYSDDPKADRKILDSAYAGAMREVARRNPDDLDIQTLFAESMMNLRPWNLWTAAGKPQPGTEEILETLERVLVLNPRHPGANHYYIHATEASPFPEKAIPAADRLGELAPGAGHLVHMPSHTYIRVGRYSDAAAVNALAAEVDRRYIARRKPEGMYPMMYYPHNVHFLWAASCLEGNRKTAMEAARQLEKDQPAEMIRAMPMLESFTPTALYGMAKFGMWKEILAEPIAPEDFKFSRGMQHYARGLAFCAQGKIEDAKKELAALEAIPPQLAPDFKVSLNLAASLLAVARNILAADIAMKEGRGEDAMKLYDEAIPMEDALQYEEPPAWYQPVRAMKAAALAELKRYPEAEAAYEEDLKRVPENGWSLFGLMETQRAQNKIQKAAETQKRFKKAWSRADVELERSRF